MIKRLWYWFVGTPEYRREAVWPRAETKTVDLKTFMDPGWEQVRETWLRILRKGEKK